MEAWPMEAIAAVLTMATEPPTICTEEAKQVMEAIRGTHTVVAMETWIMQVMVEGTPTLNHSNL